MAIRATEKKIAVAFFFFYYLWEHEAILRALRMSASTWNPSRLRACKFVIIIIIITLVVFNCSIETMTMKKKKRFTFIKNLKLNFFFINKIIIKMWKMKIIKVGRLTWLTVCATVFDLHFFFLSPEKKKTNIVKPRVVDDARATVTVLFITKLPLANKNKNKRKIIVV